MYEIGVTIHCDQHEDLQDDNGFDEIDPELDALLSDALGDFMICDMYPSAFGFAMIDVGQLQL